MSIADLSVKDLQLEITTGMHVLMGALRSVTFTADALRREGALSIDATRSLAALVLTTGDALQELQRWCLSQVRGGHASTLEEVQESLKDALQIIAAARDQLAVHASQEPST